MPYKIVDRPPKIIHNVYLCLDEIFYNIYHGHTETASILFTCRMIQSSPIILTASAGGSKGTPALSVYNATKAAIRSFARSWTVDLKHRKIRVNAISPGPINTPAVSRL